MNCTGGIGNFKAGQNSITTLSYCDRLKVLIDRMCFCPVLYVFCPVLYVFCPVLYVFSLTHFCTKIFIRLDIYAVLYDVYYCLDT